MKKLVIAITMGALAVTSPLGVSPAAAVPGTTNRADAYVDIWCDSDPIEPRRDRSRVDHARQQRPRGRSRGRCPRQARGRSGDPAGEGPGRQGHRDRALQRDGRCGAGMVLRRGLRPTGLMGGTDRPVPSGSGARRSVALDINAPPPARPSWITDHGTVVEDTAEIVELGAFEGGFVVKPAEIRPGIGRRSHALMLCAWVIAFGLCIGAAVIWSPAEGTPGSRIVAFATGPDSRVALPKPTSNPEILTARPSGQSQRGASFVVLLPTKGDYLVGPTIPIAGCIFPRPHGVPVRSVVVRLVVRGRVVVEAVLPVHRGRFVGTLHVDAIRERTAAALEVARAPSPEGALVIRQLLIDPYDK